MALPTTQQRREFDNFEEVGGLVHRRVTGSINTTASGLSIAGKITEVVLNSTTFTDLPATALTDRNAIGIQNLSGINIKINFVDAAGFVGWQVTNGNEWYVDVTDAITVKAKAASGTPTITIMELS